MQINQVQLEQGIWPPGDKEIVIDRYKLSQTNAHLGDMVTIEIPSGKTRQLKLVGVVRQLCLRGFSLQELKEEFPHLIAEGEGVAVGGVFAEADFVVGVEGFIEGAEGDVAVVGAAG